MPDTAFHDIFCIYHPADIVFVRRLAAQMRASGIDCWFDDGDFGKLSAESGQLKAGILRAYTVAIVLSPDSAESQLCNELIQHAISHSKRIVTLIRDDKIGVEVHPAIPGNPYLFFREQDDLVERIEQLRSHLRVDDDLRLHTELLVAADRWRSSGRKGEDLLPAGRWDEARRWLARANRREPKPSQLQVEYIHSSRRGREPRKRARTLALVLTALILIGAGAFLLQLLGAAISSGQAAAVQTQAAQTQAAQYAAEASAASEGALGLIDQIAATSARVSESLGATATAATATAQAAQVTAQARATIARATQAHLPMRPDDGRRLLRAARQDFADGNTDLALALAWEAKEFLDDASSAHRLLREIADSLGALALDDELLLQARPGGGELGAARTGEILPEALPNTRLAGNRLLLVEPGGISLRHPDSGEAVLQLPTGLVASSDELVAHYDGEGVRIYNLESGDEIHGWQAPLGDLRALWLAGDGRLVAARGRRLWLLTIETASPAPLGLGEAGWAHDVVFDADDQHFLSLHDELALLWDGRDGSALGAFPLGSAGGAGIQAAFHNDALLFFAPFESGLATLTRLSLADYRLERWALVDVAAGTLSRDGTLAVAQIDGDIEIIDARDGSLQRRITGIGEPADKLSIMPEAGFVLAAFGDELTIWHIESGELEARFPQLLPIVDFSGGSDAKQILTRDADDVLRLWQLESAESLLERIEKQFQPRELTCAERERHNARPLCL